MKFLYGLHDPGGEHLFADAKGWITFTEAVGSDAGDKSGRDYRQWTDAGYGVIVRLNNGYGSSGTIPLPAHYDDFALRVSNFIAASKGCDTWIIGNETNHSQERPQGQTITPAMYVDCFKRVHAHVRLMTGTRHALIPAPVAPWNLESGDWLEYHKTIWRDLWQLAGGVAIHVYTHGPSHALITSEERVQGWHWHFRTYRDQLGAIPDKARGLPVFITESNQGDNAWVDANTGWVQAAYDEINRWNAMEGTQKIACLCLYRWPAYDRWAIVDKPGVHADIRAAVAKGYQSPLGGTMQPQPTPSPTLTAPYPDDWDPRLTERGVKIERVLPGAPGTLRWRVTKGVWLDEQESQGRHHFYADVYADNQPVIGAILCARWPGDGYATFPMEAKPGEEPGANFPMSSSLNEFSFQVNEPKHPSDVVTGVGMGANGNPSIHTSTYIEWTLDRTPQSTTPPASTATMWVTATAGLYLRASPEGDVLIAIPYAAPVTITGVPTINGWLRAAYAGHTGWIASAYVSTTKPQSTIHLPNIVGDPPEVDEPPTAQPVDTWQRSRAFVARWEGEYQNVHNDAGNWTGGVVGEGELKGTKYGISAASYPHLDIKNLTMAQADTIYRTDYWQRSGADKLPWPACLLVLDTAVLHGVGKAQEWLNEVGPNPYIFAAKRLRVYTKMSNFDFWGKAWILRVADLLEECAK